MDMRRKRGNDPYTSCESVPPKEPRPYPTPPYITVHHPASFGLCLPACLPGRHQIQPATHVRSVHGTWFDTPPATLHAWRASLRCHQTQFQQGALEFSNAFRSVFAGRLTFDELTTGLCSTPAVYFALPFSAQGTSCHTWRRANLNRDAPGRSPRLRCTTTCQRSMCTFRTEGWNMERHGAYHLPKSIFRTARHN